MEGTTESVNPSVFGRSDHVSTKALVKISQDMARVLDRLTAPRTSIGPFFCSQLTPKKLNFKKHQNNVKCVFKNRSQ